MTEAEFQSRIEVFARKCGWEFYHVKRPDLGRITCKGFPDLILRKGTEIVVAELKTDKGRMREGQEEWLSAFEVNGIRTFVCRPRNQGDLCRELQRHS